MWSLRWALEGEVVGERGLGDGLLPLRCTSDMVDPVLFKAPSCREETLHRSILSASWCSLEATHHGVWPDTRKVWAGDGQSAGDVDQFLHEFVPISTDAAHDMRWLGHLRRRSDDFPERASALSYTLESPKTRSNIGCEARELCGALLKRCLNMVSVRIQTDPSDCSGSAVGSPWSTSVWALFDYSWANYSRSDLSSNVQV